eukprot:3279403-Amphidinium_carterae.1
MDLGCFEKAHTPKRIGKAVSCAMRVCRAGSAQNRTIQLFPLERSFAQRDSCSEQFVPRVTSL